jgi:predicted nucleic acid-binding protein
VTERIILDAGPLAKISHPRPNRDIADWFAARLREGSEIIIPEIADYEVRRELLRAGKTKGIDRLNQLKMQLTYLPLDTAMILKAAEFWALARNQGRPTADPSELDCDVILAAQAERVDAIVATENVGHLSLFVDARDWRTID